MVHIMGMAENRDTSKTVSFESFVAKEGFSMDEHELLRNSKNWQSRLTSANFGVIILQNDVLPDYEL